MPVKGDWVAAACCGSSFESVRLDKKNSPHQLLNCSSHYQMACDSPNLLDFGYVGLLLHHTHFPRQTLESTIHKSAGSHPHLQLFHEADYRRPGPR